MPFDQIIWWSSGASIAEAGDIVSSSEQVEVFGRTSTRDPDSTFSALTPGDTTYNNGSYTIPHDTIETTYTAAGTNGIILTDTNMDNLESNGKVFQGIHADNPIEVTWNGGRTNGFYIVLEETGTRSAGLFNVPVPGGGAQESFYETDGTRGFVPWSISVLIDDTLQRLDTYTTLAGDGTASGSGGTTITLSGGTLTAKQEFAPGFKIKFENGQEREVTQINSDAEITIESSATFLDGQAYEVMVPDGSPDTSKIHHPTKSDTTASATTLGAYENKTWGFIPVKWFNDGAGTAASSIFETAGPTDHDSDASTPGIANHPSRSPHFSHDGSTFPRTSESSKDLVNSLVGNYNLASELTRIFFPSYGVDYKTEFIGTDTATAIGYGGSDHDIFTAAYGGRVDTIAERDIPGVIQRQHGGVTSSRIGTSDATEFQEKVSQNYPYLKAVYSEEDDGTPIEKRVYVTLWDSDETLTPGQKIGVSFANSAGFSPVMANYFFGDSYLSLIYLFPGAEQLVGIPDLGKYKIHIVAKAN